MKKLNLVIAVFALGLSACKTVEADITPVVPNVEVVNAPVLKELPFKNDFSQCEHYQGLKDITIDTRKGKRALLNQLKGLSRHWDIDYLRLACNFPDKVTFFYDTEGFVIDTRYEGSVYTLEYGLGDNYGSALTFASASSASYHRSSSVKQNKDVLAVYNTLNQNTMQYMTTYPMSDLSRLLYTVDGKIPTDKQASKFGIQLWLK